MQCTCVGCWLLPPHNLMQHTFSCCWNLLAVWTDVASSNGSNSFTTNSMPIALMFLGHKVGKNKFSEQGCGQSIGFLSRGLKNIKTFFLIIARKSVYLFIFFFFFFFFLVLSSKTPFPLSPPLLPPYCWLFAYLNCQH